MKTRGKFKSPRALAAKTITRSYYYLKKFPAIQGGERYTVTFEGRKKFRAELANRSIRDKSIPQILTKAYNKNLNLATTSVTIANHAFFRFGKNSQKAIEYLESIADSIRKQYVQIGSASAETASHKKGLSRESRQTLTNDITHIAKTDLSLFRKIIECAILKLKQMPREDLK